jgi:hypothetical protein
MQRFVVRIEWPGDAPAPPAPVDATTSVVLRALDPPHRRVRFDTFTSEAAARAAGAAGAASEGYRLLLETAGRWTQPARYAVAAEWQVTDLAAAGAFEASRRALFAVRRAHLPTFAWDWLLQRLDVAGRYLVLGWYGDEAGARSLCRTHPEIRRFTQAHPATAYTATDLSGLQVFRAEHQGDAARGAGALPLVGAADAADAPAGSAAHDA